MSVGWGFPCNNEEEIELDSIEDICNFTDVSQLDLSDSNLTGEIPSCLGNLINLTCLDLSSNQLSGDIPLEIGNLTNLTSLWLSDNQLSGEIPESICNLTLNFSDNHFSISNNFFCPPYPDCLTEEEVGWQDITDNSVCPCDDGFVNLWGECYSIDITDYIYLANSEITGVIPSGIGNLVNLEWLFLYNNQLTGEIPLEIGNLTNLYSLYLYDNQLTGEIPESICNLNQLNEIELSWNYLCPPYPNCLTEEDIGYQDTSNCEDECGAALGDVNGDGQINILDLVQIANLILETSTPLYECAADYNGDGQVNILDLVQIANYIISTS